MRMVQCRCYNDYKYYCGGFGIITNIRIDINNEKVFYIDWYYDSGSIEKINIHEKSEVFKIISISQ